MQIDAPHRTPRVALTPPRIIFACIFRKYCSNALQTEGAIIINQEFMARVCTHIRKSIDPSACSPKHCSLKSVSHTLHGLRTSHMLHTPPLHVTLPEEAGIAFSLVDCSRTLPQGSSAHIASNTFHKHFRLTDQLSAELLPGMHSTQECIL